MRPAPAAARRWRPTPRSRKGISDPLSIDLLRWDMRPYAVLMLAAGVCLAQPPIAPHSAFEPPAAKAAASLASSTKASPSDLVTTGEKSDWNETAPYAEAVEISRRLEKASRFVKVLEIGASAEGRPMIALILSKDPAF